MAKRKNQDQDKPNENINESDDAFGLPEIEYEPLKREEPVEEKQEEQAKEPVYESSSYSETSEVTEQSSYEPSHEEMVEEEQQYVYTPPAEEPSPIWPKMLLVILLLAVVGAGVWYFGFYQPKQEKLAEQARLEQAKRDEETRKRRAEEERQRLINEEQQRKADSIAAANAKPAEGIVEFLSDRTGRYYVVVASSIDDDLITDYANELKGKGVSSKVIPPFRGVKFYRLAIADRDTYNEAQSFADQVKGDYGNGVWVIRY